MLRFRTKITVMKWSFIQSSSAIKYASIFFGMISTNLYALTKDTKLTPVDSILPMLGGLIVILIFIFGLAYLFKRFSNFSPTGGNIQVLETKSIGQKERIIIIQVRDQQFLLGVTGQSINQLAELNVDKTTKQLIDQEKPSYPQSPSPQSSGQKQHSTFSTIISALTRPSQTKPSQTNPSRETASTVSRNSSSIQ